MIQWSSRIQTDLSAIVLPENSFLSIGIHFYDDKFGSFGNIAKKSLVMELAIFGWLVFSNKIFIHDNEYCSFFTIIMSHRVMNRDQNRLDRFISEDALRMLFARAFTVTSSLGGTGIDRWSPHIFIIEIHAEERKRKAIEMWLCKIPVSFERQLEQRRVPTLRCFQRQPLDPSNRIIWR